MTYPGLTRAEVFEGQCARIRATAKLDPSTGCREWQGRLNSNGYGVIRINGKSQYAHRVTYAIRNGEIPEGLVVDHLCRNPLCCNPDHLEVVTQRENALRGMSPIAISVRTNRCFRGHEFTPGNTYTAKKTGYRQCKTCNSIRRLALIAKRMGVTP